jgi:hypothetical protein
VASTAAIAAIAIHSAAGKKALNYGHSFSFGRTKQAVSLDVRSAYNRLAKRIAARSVLFDAEASSIKQRRRLLR